MRNGHGRELSNLDQSAPRLNPVTFVIDKILYAVFFIFNVSSLFSRFGQWSLIWWLTLHSAGWKDRGAYLLLNVSCAMLLLERKVRRSKVADV